MKVLVATDGSKQSLRAARHLKSFADPAKIEEVLVLAVTRPLASVSFVRAAQFHEFCFQTLERTALGPVCVVPTMRSQPVAAAEVAPLLVDVATRAPQGEGPSLAGPEEIRVADMIRRFSEHEGRRRLVMEAPLPGAFGRAMRDGTLLGDAESRIGSQTFDSWLEQRAA